jgi:hypothetical protein
MNTLDFDQGLFRKNHGQIARGFVIQEEGGKSRSAQADFSER